MVGGTRTEDKQTIRLIHLIGYWSALPLKLIATKGMVAISMNRRSFIFSIRPIFMIQLKDETASTRAWFLCLAAAAYAVPLAHLVSLSLSVSHVLKHSKIATRGGDLGETGGDGRS